ncbi:hypothetical protein [Marinobacterium sp. BA1]|uniref:hypothetical protein n=1 Tax=Marinobacterium sp. BA1 TaxID=3138931 RepID=UPI0034E8CECA
MQGCIQASWVRTLQSQARFAHIGVDLLFGHVDPQRASEALQRASDVWWQTLLCQAELVKQLSNSDEESSHE